MKRIKIELIYTFTDKAEIDMDAALAEEGSFEPFIPEIKAALLEDLAYSPADINEGYGIDENSIIITLLDDHDVIQT